MTGAARRWQALALHPDDDVAVALTDLDAGSQVDVWRDGSLERRHLAEDVPLGHKLALHALARGAPVRKYGECIGVAACDIAAGAHVHVHNLQSRRGRHAS